MSGSRPSTSGARRWRPRRPTWPSSSDGPAAEHPGLARRAERRRQRGRRRRTGPARRRGGAARRRAPASPPRGPGRGAGPSGRRRERRARRRGARSASAGVLGVLKDLVDIDDGWVAAFEAAVGAALGAVVVEGSDAARAVLGTPPRARGGGDRARRRVGECTVVGCSATRRRGFGRRPSTGPELAARATCVPGCRRWPASSIGCSHGVVARARATGPGPSTWPWNDPELTVVSTDGDRFSSAGWVVRAGAHALATAGQPGRASKRRWRPRAAERAASFAEQARAARRGGAGRGR